jgi:hypothetical protein
MQPARPCGLRRIKLEHQSREQIAADMVGNLVSNVTTASYAAVNAVCPLTLAGRPLLARGSGDRTVRIWDLWIGASLGTILRVTKFWQLRKSVAP